jgi:hypothetical protein
VIFSKKKNLGFSSSNVKDICLLHKLFVNQRVQVIQREGIVGG